MSSAQRQLQRCVEQADLEGASSILNAEPPLTQQWWANTATEAGFSMLMSVAAMRSAAPEARVGLLQLLLKAGAEATKSDDDGYTALHWAAAIGTRDVMRPLVRLTSRFPLISARFPLFLRSLLPLTLAHCRCS